MSTQLGRKYCGIKVCDAEILENITCYEHQQNDTQDTKKYYCSAWISYICRNKVAIK